MNARPAIWTTYYPHLSPEDAICALIRGGFVCGDFDYQQEYMLLERGKDRETTAKEFRSFLDGVGFSVPQGHLDLEEDFALPETVEARKREIDFFYTLGVRCAVIHLSGAREDPQDLRREKNLESLRRLQEYVRGTDMTICVENMNSIHTIRDGKRIMQILKDLGYTNLGVCLDTGHLNSGRVKGYTAETQREFILQAGEHLKALHLNGNNGRADQHVAPFCIHSAPDFMEIVSALHEVNYTGLFSLENGGDAGDDVPRSVLDRRLVYLRDLLSLMMDPNFVSSR